MNAVLLACFVFAQSQTPDSKQEDVAEIHLQVCSALEVAAWAHDHSPITMMALAWKESSFKRESVSKAGCVGVMQVMPRYSPFTHRELLTLDGGVQGGMTAVTYWKERHGSKWMHCYNSGNPCNAPEYVEDVLGFRATLQALTVLFEVFPELAPVI